MDDENMESQILSKDYLDDLNVEESVRMTKAYDRVTAYKEDKILRS